MIRRTTFVLAVAGLLLAAVPVSAGQPNDHSNGNRVLWVDSNTWQAEMSMPSCEGGTYGNDWIDVPGPALFERVQTFFGKPDGSRVGYTYLLTGVSADGSYTWTQHIRERVNGIAAGPGEGPSAINTHFMSTFSDSKGPYAHQMMQENRGFYGNGEPKDHKVVDSGIICAREMLLP